MSQNELLAPQKIMAICISMTFFGFLATIIAQEVIASSASAIFFFLITLIGAAGMLLAQVLIAAEEGSHPSPRD